METFLKKYNRDFPKVVEPPEIHHMDCHIPEDYISVTWIISLFISHTDTRIEKTLFLP